MGYISIVEYVDSNVSIKDPVNFNQEELLEELEEKTGSIAFLFDFSVDGDNLEISSCESVKAYEIEEDLENMIAIFEKHNLKINSFDFILCGEDHFDIKKFSFNEDKFTVKKGRVVFDD